METVAEVLVIEDEEALRLQIRQLVALWGYRVRVAPDADAGLDEIRQAPPDIVLTDLVMPGSTGYDVLGYVRQHCPHVPVLVMTAYVSLDSAVAALKQGAYDYLLKPITPPELEAALIRAAAAVDLHRARARESQLQHIAAVALTLAHEINNPLALIMGEIQLQLEASDGPPDRQSLDVCLEAARRIAETIRRLTDLRDVTYEQYAGLNMLNLEQPEPR